MGNLNAVTPSRVSKYELLYAMKHLRFFKFLPVLAAGLLLAVPESSLAKDKITVYRDNDGDGHYNKKTYKTDHYRRDYGHSRGSYYYNDNRYYGRPYTYQRPYYSSPSLSFSYSRPAYSSRSNYYADDLTVDVQRELRRRGYYRGAIDGDAGPGTRAAIRAYQDDRGLAVTGRIDRSLLRALGVG